MSKGPAKWRKSSSQRAEEQLRAKQHELERVAAKEAASPTKRVGGKLLLKPTKDKEDALAGVISERVLLLSTDSEGKSLRTRTLPWNWNPPLGSDPVNPSRLGEQRDPEVFVHGDGWTTAHPGSLAAANQEDDDERAMRAAGLTEEERAVARLGAEVDVRGRALLTRQEIAAKLGISFWQVHARVKSGNRKLVEYGAALKEIADGLAETPRRQVAELRRRLEEEAHEAL